MEIYLQHCDVIDWQHPLVESKALALSKGVKDDVDIARCCFEFVRDEIQHSWDAQRDICTCSASEVLTQGTGWCYAKSHLLAALLRANGIPAGLCYQRLSIDDNGAPFSLHGLNAVYLKEFGWYRIDSRGNNENVHAAFTPPQEKLAYPIQFEGEADLSGIWSEPHPVVVKALNRFKRCVEMRNHLPDVELF